jgi:hypothetical protein
MSGENSTRARLATLSAQFRNRLAVVPGQLRSRLATTGSLSTGVLRRPDSLLAFLVVTVAYLLTYLVVMNDLTIGLGAGFAVEQVVAEPFSRMFEPGPGQFQYEAVAVLEVGIGIWVFSPLNTAIGLAVSVLVGLNLALSYLAVTQPRSCGLEAGTGVFAAVPALFAGSACCGPVIFLVIGIQASGVLLTAFQWLLPASVLLLLGSLVFIAGKVDPTAV